jgi:hypothetical protein
MLLMGGTKSQGYLKLALDTSGAAFPQANHVELRGLGHTAADKGNSPEDIFQSGGMR